jgi:hypothetical protein
MLFLGNILCDHVIPGELTYGGLKIYESQDRECPGQIKIISVPEENPQKFFDTGVDISLSHHSFKVTATMVDHE